MPTMRDAFFLQIFEQAKKDPNIIVLSSDFSAPSFDRFRTELSGQFINTGISEQNSILIAAGLALSGKTVFVTSIAPFITMRCFEQTRLFAADMNLNIKIVAVGAGFSYNTAGSTHHSFEDIALMRTLPNMRILMPCCNSQVEAFAKQCVDSKGPVYIRLDRMFLEEVDSEKKLLTDSGFCILRPIAPITIVATGYMTHTALKTADILQTKGLSVGVVDIHCIPFDDKFIDIIKGVKHLITVEEHVKQGGLGSIICELLIDNNLPLSLKRFALDFSHGFYHKYGSRDHIHDACGIGVLRLVEYVKRVMDDYHER